MSRKFQFTITLLFSFFLITCIKDPAAISADKKKVARQLTVSEQSLVKSDNEFGLKLFQKVVEQEGEKNIFISPLSVSMALGMTCNGANGSTKEAMENTLELSHLTIQQINESYKTLIELLTSLDSKVTLDIANSIWYRQEFTFEPEFIDLNKTYFNAEVSGLNFNDPNSVGIINNWVDKNTNGRITEVINSINPLDVMFLINAIYFKGTWTYEFDKDLTKDDWFYLSTGSEVACKMMEQKGDFQYFANADFEAADLPYGDGYFSMTIILPKPGTNIDDIIARFTPDDWEEWMSGFKKQGLVVQMPKFKLQYKLSLIPTLSALGMEIAFTDQADFTRMYPPGDLYISDVKHKTFVEVNEEGSEAAAVSSVTIGITSLGDPTIPVFRVDRPFIFVIRDQHSGSIIFAGKIIEPVIE
jgi:serpin B